MSFTIFRVRESQWYDHDRQFFTNFGKEKSVSSLDKYIAI